MYTLEDCPSTRARNFRANVSSVQVAHIQTGVLQDSFSLAVIPSLYYAVFRLGVHLGTWNTLFS